MGMNSSTKHSLSFGCPGIYVFLGASYLMHTRVFSIAIHFAMGTRIALAPAVLASVYRDLGLLKGKIVASNQW